MQARASRLIVVGAIERIGIRPPLDALSVSPSSAYSVRKTRTSYAGSCMRVRRSSDNAEQDFGFRADGWLDTTALLAFVGAGSGYVTVWYDQSGNGLDLTQATSAAQPAIVLSGVLQTKNSMPFIAFFGVVLGQANFLQLASPMTTVGTANAVMVVAPAGDGFFLGSGSTFNWHSTPDVALIGSPASTSVKTGTGYYNGTSTVPTVIPWPTSLSVVSLMPLTPATGTTWENIGRDRNVHHTTAGGGWSELTTFLTALSTADRNLLERNQGSAYSVSVA